MLKKYKFNRIFFFLPMLTLMFCFNSPKDDEEKMKTIMISVRNTLSYLHYSPKAINDAYSKEVYTKYFEMVDPAKRYFLQSDMEEFQRHQTKLDDYFNQGDLTFFKLTNTRLLQRVNEIDKITKDILSNQINLEEEEDLIIDEKLKSAPKNQKELYSEWRRYIKYNILQEIESLNIKEETQRKRKDSVQKNKLQDTIKLEILSQDVKLEKAKKEVSDLMGDSFTRFKKVKQMDWFTRYMNAYAEVFDPHTTYFSPKDKEDFDVNFTGKITGIGAIIQEKRGYLYLGALTVGAPAWKSQKLTEGDKILKVKPLPNKEPINMVGMLSDEAVRYIRGEKGTEVTLTVEKKDKSIQEVTMIREEVSIEDTFARSIIVDSPDGKKYGLINLPNFNSDINEDGSRNASDDIQEELIKLKAQNVEGIILDLRNNGGGSLTEVGDIMGLFMKSGPYVQVKDGKGKVQTLKNKNDNPLWTGPLVIMQNELSASASEILAGMMQDYGRAVVLGSPQSFGKGTVQTFVDLNRFLSTNDDFGALKLTIQKFYRITGESTQRKGINSDVVMEDLYSYIDIGEKYDHYALPWDIVPPSAYNKLNQFNINDLRAKSDLRIKNNKTYQLVLESAKWRESLDKVERISLNKNKFFAQMRERKNKIENFEKLEKELIAKKEKTLQFSIYPDEILREKEDKTFKRKTENWIKNLKRDIYLQEAVNIVSDMIR